MGANLNISIGATVEPLKKAIAGVITLMSNFASTMGSQGVAMKAQIDAAATEINASLAEATSSFEKFGGEGDKSGKKSAGSMGSLKQQIRLAVNEAASLSQQFGMDAAAAVKAQQKAANLKEEMSDLTARIAAMNPEAKFKALGDAAKGVSGAFGAATGAMQLLGGESEATQAAMAKLQAIMAITQGLDAIQALPDAFKTLKISIMGATAGMSALKVALITTGIGALIIGVGLLAANWDKVTGSADDADKKQKEVIENQKKFEEEFDAAVQKKVSDAEKQFLLYQSLYILFKDNDILAAKRTLELATIKKKSAAEIHILQLAELNLEVEKTKHLLDAAKNETKLFELKAGYNKDLSELNHKIAVENAKFEQDKIDKGKETANELIQFKKAQTQKQIELDKQSQERYNKYQDELKEKAKQTAEALLESHMIVYNAPPPNKIWGHYKNALHDAGAEAAVTGNQHVLLKAKVDAAKTAAIEYQKILGEGNTKTDEYKNKLKEATAELKKFDDAQKRGKDNATTMNQAISKLASEGFVQLGTALGNVISGKGGFDALFSGILGSVADFLVNIGTGLIATALAIEAFKETILENPIAAVAIGVVAIAAGVALKNYIAQGPSFAVGAMNVPFDMNANIHKGEMIIPKPFADDLRKGNGLGGGNMQVAGLIRGRDLAILAKKNGQSNLRVTGRTR